MAAPSNLAGHLAATPSAGVHRSAHAFPRTKDEERDWTVLLPELIRKIAVEALLPVDVTEYIRLRAVCKPWRTATVDPSTLHPRFFPRYWLMLKPRDEEPVVDEEDMDEVDLDMVPQEEDAEDCKDADANKNMVEAVVSRRFVNVRTGDMLRIQMPPVEEYGYVLTTASTAEGLLLFNCERTNTVRLFNPLTMATVMLPGLAGAPIPADALLFTSAGVLFDVESPDHPTVVLVVTGLGSVTILHAKPGDQQWGTVDISVVVVDGAEGPPPIKRGLSLHGRFFVTTTRQGDVLEVLLGGAPRPRLAYVLRRQCTCVMPDISCYLVPSLDEAADDNDGMLLVRCDGTTVVDVRGVHLGNRKYTLLMGLGNRTVFLPSLTVRFRAGKFPGLPQGMVHQHYDLIEDYIGYSE
ncbi:hypothetical protein QOZ80_5BG0439510 [Eleusine coracana subsp. coracana]|nr:hypothetical protein QOZ80_5BG0439510 [Eleusine coracana subsp. coracana]